MKETVGSDDPTAPAARAPHLLFIRLKRALWTSLRLGGQGGGVSDKESGN